MDFKIYGNEEPLRLASEMISKGREPHSVVVYGDKGLGKKTFAKYLAAALMCEEHNGTPCGKCKSCKMMEDNCHPDYMVIQPNDKGNYKVDDVRPVVSDSVVKPNEGRLKVYVIPDLDMSVSTMIQVQNILLKLIEEPPDHCVIILTARSKETFLPTILSRVLCFGMVDVKTSDSMNFLKENFPEISEKDIADAVSAGRGNIGRCVSYIKKEQFFYSVLTARTMALAATEGNEYVILKALTDASSKKQQFRESVYLFSEIVRDACVYRLGDTESELSVSCDRNGAVKLGNKLSSDNAVRLYDLLCDYVNRIDSNANAVLTANSLAGQIAQFCK